LTAISEAGLERALTYLRDDRRPTERTSLLPAHVCDAIIARHGADEPAIGIERAEKATLMLLAGFPNALMGDSADKLPYMRRIRDVLAKYPERAVRQVISPGFRFKGNPSYRPNDKEVADALDEAVLSFRAYAVRAQWHKDEAVRRAEQKRLDEVIPIDAERRAQIVRRLLAP
jgi:hypothetical protein